MFRVHWDTNNITVVALLVTTICVIVKVCQKLLYRRNGPVDRRTSNRNTYTACNSETCVRCHRYNNLRLDAPGKLNDFASKSGWSGLERLRKSLTSIGHPEGEVPDVTHRPNVLFVGGIESVPWWNADCFPANTELLEKNYENILDEYENEASSSSGWVLNSTESGRWKAFFLINQGCRVTENCRRCPKTMDLVENCLQNVMKECVFGNVFFSVVEAGTCISEHCGPANVRVRCHLGKHIEHELGPTATFRKYMKAKRILYWVGIYV